MLGDSTLTPHASPIFMYQVIGNDRPCHFVLPFPVRKMSKPTYTPMTTSNTGSTEEHTVSSDKLLDKVKQIVREGNARKITLKNESGKVLMEIPLTIGIASVVLIPVWVAIGTIAALAGRYTIVVEKRT
jgi:hypothetical protein